MQVPSAIELDGTERSLDPRVRVWWAVRRSATWVILGLGWAVGALVQGHPIAAGIVAIGVVVATLLSVGSAALSYRYWSWAVHDDAIEITHGVVYRHQSVVPHHRIQQIDIERGPLERMLGLATLILRSAAATTDARIPGIPVARSDAVRHALLDRVGVGDAV